MFDLDRVDRVLERRVVELDHVDALGLAAVKATRQVHVDEVEPAGAEPEVAGLDVDDHLVAHLDPADQARVGPGGTPVAPDFDRERVGVDHDPTAQLQHPGLTRRLAGELGDRLADREHLGDSRRADALRGRVVGLGAVGEQHAVEPAGDERVRVAAASARHLARLDAAALERRARNRDGG